MSFNIFNTNLSIIRISEVAQDPIFNALIALTPPGEGFLALCSSVELRATSAAKPLAGYTSAEVLKK